MASPPCEPLSLHQVLSDSRRIFKLQWRHFQTLSLLFLFPLSLCSFLYLTLQKKIHQLLLLQSHDHQSSINSNQNLYPFVLLPLFYSLVSSLFFFSAAASISFSTYRVSRDEHVDLILSLKSILRSFWPLVSTSLVTGLVIGVLVATPFVILAVSVYKWLHESSYLIPLMVLIFALLIVYLQVKWMLVYVVVVVESRWGLAPLKRSEDLVKRNRGVALKMLLCFQLITTWTLWVFRGSGSGGSGGWWTGPLMILSGSLILSQIMLAYFVAATVLYIYCRESDEGVLPSQKNIHPEKFPLLLQ